MNIFRTYKFKLYRSQKHRYLHQRIDIAGRIYNHCIALHRRYYCLTGKHLSQYTLMKHIARLKKRPRYADWRVVGSQAVQDIVQRIEKGYALFFRNLAAGVKTAPPGFKKVRKYKSFTLKQAGYKLLADNRILIQGRIYKYARSRDIAGDIKTVTIKRTSNGCLYLCFSVEQEIAVPNRMGQSTVGLDFGLKTFLTLSDNTSVQSPQFLRSALNDLAKANRRLSRRVKYSPGWWQAHRMLDKVHERIANLRRDWFFKLAHKLTDAYDFIFLEDLNLRGMKRLWGRKVSDLAFATFLDILKYVAQAKGVVVHQVHRFYPSSKTCSGCGHLHHELTVADRRWRCPGCGAANDRDHNAALNIEREGASSLGLVPVSPLLGVGR